MHSNAMHYNTKIIRKTIERMIQRMHYVSHPTFCSFPGQNEAWEDGRCFVDDDDNVTSHIACICIITILILYGVIILLKRYENEHGQ